MSVLRSTESDRVPGRDWCCRRRGHRPVGPRPRRPRQPQRPGGRRRPAAGAARGRGPATRSPPWPPGPPPRPASTTRWPSPGCWRSYGRPGPTTRSPPCWPQPRRPRQPRQPGDVASLLRVLRAAGARRRGHRPGHPGRQRRHVRSSWRSALTRPPVTRSGASQTEPHRKPGMGKSRPARTAVCTLVWLRFDAKAQLNGATARPTLARGASYPARIERQAGGVPVTCWLDTRAGWPGHRRLISVCGVRRGSRCRRSCRRAGCRPGWSRWRRGQGGGARPRRRRRC
jgi:hypothetical protein